MPDICALHHAGLLVSDLGRAKVFYESVLGLKVYPNRPDLPYPGEWYDLGGGQQLHLMQLPNPDAASVRPEQIPVSDPLANVRGASSIAHFDIDTLPSGLTLISHDPGPDTTAYDLMADFINAVKN